MTSKQRRSDGSPTSSSLRDGWRDAVTASDEATITRLSTLRKLLAHAALRSADDHDRPPDNRHTGPVSQTLTPSKGDQDAPSPESPGSNGDSPIEQ
jgi:hypothetical protein